MKLFTKVHCKAYMKKISDGVYIALTDENGKSVSSPQEAKIAIACKSNGEIIKDLSDFDGDCVEKTYRQRTKKSFNGFLVGYTYIDVKGLIGTDYHEDCYHSYKFLSKDVTDKPKVAVVYFRNNCKRYVLLDDIEEYEEYKPDSNKECPIKGQMTFDDLNPVEENYM